MPQKMSFGSGMTRTTLGIKEDFKEEEHGKEKEKEDKVEDSSSHEAKKKVKERKQGKSHLAGDESYWAQDEWQGTETENWNESYWAYEDETAWQSQGLRLG